MEIGRQDVGYRVAYGDERRRRIGRRSGRNTPPVRGNLGMKDISFPLAWLDVGIRYE
jgi:hypothetical protein